MAAASRSAQWAARFASGLLRVSYTTNRDATQNPARMRVARRFHSSLAQANCNGFDA
jgi:hypothetical protein